MNIKALLFGLVITAATALSYVATQDNGSDQQGPVDATKIKVPTRN